MCVYLQWAGAKGIKSCTEKLPLESLDVIFQKFFAEIHKKWSGL